MYVNLSRAWFLNYRLCAAATTIDCLCRQMRRAYQQKKAVAAGSLVAARVGCGHYYEVIREGAPCHLYFDIEYKRAYAHSAVASTHSLPRT